MVLVAGLCPATGAAVDVVAVPATQAAEVGEEFQVELWLIDDGEAPDPNGVSWFIGHMPYDEGAVEPELLDVENGDVNSWVYWFGPGNVGIYGECFCETPPLRLLTFTFVAHEAGLVVIRPSDGGCVDRCSNPQWPLTGEFCGATIQVVEPAPMPDLESSNPGILRSFPAEWPWE